MDGGGGHRLVSLLPLAWMPDNTAMQRQLGFGLGLLGLGVLAYWLGPRPVFEPWVAEDLSPARAQALGFEGSLGPLSDGPWERLEADYRSAHPVGGGLPRSGTPAVLLDVDSDGDLDFFAARALETASGPASPVLFMRQDGQFLEVSQYLGSAFTQPRTAVHSWARDVNQDGRVDVVLELDGGGKTVLWNRFEQNNGVAK